jgi:5-methylthioadenosine/S-adenosylhomocysteine deaminase
MMHGSNNERGGPVGVTILVPERLAVGTVLAADHAVVVGDDGRIQDVGPTDAVIARHRDADVVRLSRRLIVPGGINGHNHSFQVLMRGLGEDKDFFGWRSQVLYPVSEMLSRDEIRRAAELAFADMLRHGITTVADFFYLNDHGIDNALAVAEAAEAVGIRLVLARTFYDWDGAPVRYRETPAEARRHTLQLAAAVKGRPLVTVQVAPHSPHGASAAMVEAAVATAEELDVPLHVHCAEGRYERQALLESTGRTPVGWLDDRGALTARTVLIHAVWVDDADLDLIAARNASVIHNPGSNMILGDGIAPVPAMLRRGITVGLGTDGGCTNDRHSLFDEMRLAALLQKVAAHDGTAMDAMTAYDMGTRQGADALRVPAGLIAPGRYADLVSLDLDDPSLLPGPVTLGHLVYALSPAAVDTVWVGGVKVVEQGRPLRVNLSWAREWQAAQGLSPR